MHKLVPKWANCMQRRTKIFCQITTTTTACRRRHIRSPGLPWTRPCCLPPAHTRSNALFGKGCILMSAFTGNCGTGIVQREHVRVWKRFVELIVHLRLCTFFPLTLYFILKLSWKSWNFVAHYFPQETGLITFLYDTSSFGVCYK